MDFVNLQPWILYSPPYLYCNCGIKQCLCSVIATPTHDHIVNMSQFTEVPVKALGLQHHLKYANSPLSAAKLREASVSSSLISRLENHLSALKLNLKYIEGLNVTDFVAKAYNIGIECPSTEEQDRLWIFSATLAIFLFEFDDHFDEPISTPEIVARLSILNWNFWSGHQICIEAI